MTPLTERDFLGWLGIKNPDVCAFVNVTARYDGQDPSPVYGRIYLTRTGQGCYDKALHAAMDQEVFIQREEEGLFDTFAQGSAPPYTRDLMTYFGTLMDCGLLEDLEGTLQKFPDHFSLAHPNSLLRNYHALSVEPLSFREEGSRHVSLYGATLFFYGGHLFTPMQKMWRRMMLAVQA